MILTRFKHQNGHLTQIEVDEVFGFMCHITTKVLFYNAVPSGAVLVRLLLDMGHNILFYVLFLQHQSSALHQVLLHLFLLVCIFDHRLLVSHGYGRAGAGWLLYAPGEGLGATQAAQESWSLLKPYHI